MTAITSYDLTAIHPDDRYEAIKSQIRAALNDPYRKENFVPKIIARLSRSELEGLLMELLREKENKR